MIPPKPSPLLAWPRTRSIPASTPVGQAVYLARHCAPAYPVSKKNSAHRAADILCELQPAISLASANISGLPRTLPSAAPEEHGAIGF
jgi:hypothetical protein